jgi:hypothetical protein
MSDMAADGLIETAMKICIYRHPTYPDQRLMRPPGADTISTHTHFFLPNQKVFRVCQKYCNGTLKIFLSICFEPIFFFTMNLVVLCTYSELHSHLYYIHLLH